MCIILCIVPYIIPEHGAIYPMDIFLELVKQKHKIDYVFGTNFIKNKLNSAFSEET